MSTFNWLHLTDLHLGMAGQKHLWPNIRDIFYDDLRKPHKQCGPWDAVLFTGDLVQRGSAC
jgi:3',5'-cyclic AMP phosphodiesterase CpdA